ncbi:signal peptide peptidase-like 2B [Rhipicephalus sanguineus]|uniref:signal peptide peptidase-like 2B n=1 Tax=Rhipicephalus sanguineus TaxID=34632 RepID=UPI0020C446A0|nr:signal peptide peptidase-like 2B [Rhipicephalus sanguineus]
MARLKNSAVSVGVPSENSDFTDSMHEVEEEFSFAVSPKLIVMFVMHMSVMLLVLYYFYRYLVHFMVIMFAMASAVALISCLEPLVNRINFGTSRVPTQVAVCCQTRMEVRHVVLLMFGMSVAITWFLLRRNVTFGWILQDLLGVAFCINMLKSIHLPNLKLLSLLLLLLLVYDVFFVFITPFLRANRESVMVEVAKGAGVKEVLPMVIKFPRIYRSGYSKCFQMKFSILGLGDILAPAYGMGMVATFLALELMRNAQPALLYLVPFTIIPTITTAWSKGHLFAIWNGVKHLGDLAHGIQVTNGIPQGPYMHEQKKRRDEVLGITLEWNKLRENGRKEEGDSDTKATTLQPNPDGQEATGGNSAPDLPSDNAEGADIGTRGQHRTRPKSKNPEDQGDEPRSSKDSNVPVQEGSSVDGGDGHGAAKDMDLAAFPCGAASPSFTEEAERLRAGAHAPGHPGSVFGREECPTADVVPASRKRLPLHLGYSPWEDRFVLSHHRKNGLRRDTSDAHATGPSTA